MKYKVVHIITGLTTGGAERALYNLLSGGLARRFDCAVVSLCDAGTFGARIEALGVPVHALGMRSGLPRPSALTRLYHVIRKIYPDVVQGWMYHGNLAASVATQMALKRPALAWNVRQSLYGLAGEKPLTRQVIRANRWFSCGTDAVLYNSRISREQHESFGFARARGQVIPNGFDLKHLGADAEIGLRVRREFGIPAEALVVGHVARFHPMKDHASFLRAAVRVADEMPATYFLMIGRGVSPDNPALVGIVPSRLMERFCFPGERQDVSDLMRAMDVFCLSSNSEAFPNVLGEAMACGLPCVTTDVGDSADVVGDTGIVVPPRDDEGLARGVLTMLSKPSEERRALGRAARARIERCYALPGIVEQYAVLYEILVSGKERRSGKSDE